MDKGFYPVQANLIDGFENESEEAALIVDIGGSVGHDLAEFQMKYPDAPGRLVLQDLPVVIGQIVELDERVERMAYDFYEVQPVRGELALLYRDEMLTLSEIRRSSILHALRAS